MDLHHRLDRERAYWLQEQPAPASAVEIMAMDYLRGLGVEGRALRVGERAPAFRLPDVQGRPVDLQDLLAQGPTVVLFYRGHWCPFCSLTLRSYQAAAQGFAALRSPVVAISPQGMAATATGPERPGEVIPLLSDSGGHVARAYGLAYDLPASLKSLFEGEYATPLPEINRDGGWTLPVSATYLIAENGTVLRAHVDVDYRRREDPAELLAWLAAYAAYHPRLGPGAVT